MQLLIFSGRAGEAVAGGSQGSAADGGQVLPQEVEILLQRPQRGEGIAAVALAVVPVPPRHLHARQLQ